MTPSRAGQSPLAASSEAALARMKSQRRVGTWPELAVRRLLHARGLRYRVDRPLGLPGVRRRSDLTFVAARVVVFVDGCFWHACPQHGTQPKSNAEWWRAKLGANVARDKETDRLLAKAGWTVVRAWEHEEPEAVAATVEAAVIARVPKR